MASLNVNVAELLREWSADNPRELNPQGPLLLAKPAHYDVVKNSPGLTLIKGLYGSGKTYGYGFNLYHDARQSQKFDVVYVALRTVVEKKKANIRGFGNIVDIINIICSGLKIQSSERHGVFMTTNDNTISSVCSQIDKYLKMAERDHIEAFRNFLTDLAKTSPKRTLLVLDEFEGMSTLMSRRGKQDIYELILSTVRALRPGVMEKYPGKLALIYLLQEVVYPSKELSDLFKKEGATLPALGRLFAYSKDGSIPVCYTEDSFTEYISHALLLLKKELSMDEDTYKQLSEIFLSKEMRRNLSLLKNMPAFNAFSLLNLVIADSVEKALNGELYNPFQSLKELLDRYPVYKIYTGRKPFKSWELATSLSNLLADVLKRGGETDIVTVPVKTRGYEGAYYLTQNETYILMLRSNDINEEGSFLKSFQRAYKDALTSCKEVSEEEKKRKGSKRDDKKCIYILLHTSDINVPKIQLALKRLNIENKKINLKIEHIEVTYDDIFNLIVAYNNVTTPLGVKDYGYEKVKEIIEKIHERLEQIRQYVSK